MGGKHAILLANHGLLTAGASIEEATMLAVWMEEAAHMQLRARAIGVIKPIAPELALESREFLRKPRTSSSIISRGARFGETPAQYSSRASRRRRRRLNRASEPPARTCCRIPFVKPPRPGVCSMGRRDRKLRCSYLSSPSTRLTSRMPRAAFRNATAQNRRKIAVCRGVGSCDPLRVASHCVGTLTRLEAE